MNKHTRSATGSDEKQVVILTAASEAFAQYGFRRVSMDEIARRAGMSRAALYLHFRNKEDIFARITRDYFAQAAKDMAAELAAQTDPVAALRAAFAAKVAPPFDKMLESPHGEELLDMNVRITSDIVAEGEACIVALFADWLRGAEAAGRVSLADLGSPEAVGRILLHAAHGAVSAATSYAGLLEDLDRQATVLGRGLRA